MAALSGKPSLVFIGFMGAGKTTAAAGTTVESVRSRNACAGSLVSVSTERSGLVRVEIGLIAARASSGWPLLMPPSRPPARLVSRK